MFLKLCVNKSKPPISALCPTAKKGQAQYLEKWAGIYIYCSLMAQTFFSATQRHNLQSYVIIAQHRVCYHLVSYDHIICCWFDVRIYIYDAWLLPIRERPMCFIANAACLSWPKAIFLYWLEHRWWSLQRSTSTANINLVFGSISHYFIYIYVHELRAADLGLSSHMRGRLHQVFILWSWSPYLPWCLECFRCRLICECDLTMVAPLMMLWCRCSNETVASFLVIQTTQSCVAMLLCQLCCSYICCMCIYATLLIEQFLTW